MSDRYETPSWGDEPDDLATRSPVAGEPREPTERPDDPGEHDLDASRPGSSTSAPVARGSCSYPSSATGLRVVRSSGSSSQLGLS